jgi:hypothetical protein
VLHVLSEIFQLAGGSLEDGSILVAAHDKLPSVDIVLGEDSNMTEAVSDGICEIGLCQISDFTTV